MIMDMVSEKENLVCTLKKGKRVFLYGAGNYGLRNFLWMKREAINVAGFVTTSKICEYSYGLRVYSLEEIVEEVNREDIIYISFRGGDKLTISKYFKKNKPCIINGNVEVMKHQSNRILLDSVSAIYDKAKVKKKRIYRQTDNKRKILVVRLDAMGDLICTTALIKELKNKYSNSEVTVIVREQNLGILEECPYIDKLVAYPTQLMDGVVEYIELENLIKKVKLFVADVLGEESVDYLYLPKDLFRGGNSIQEILFAIFVNAEHTVGHLTRCDEDTDYIYNSLNNFFSKIIVQNRARHETEFQLEMLAYDDKHIEDCHMELWCDKNSDIKINQLLQKNNILDKEILVAVGLVGSSPERNWKPDNYCELFKKLYSYEDVKINYLLFGGNDACKAAEYILNTSKDNVFDFTGRFSIKESIALMSRCDLYVGANTGLLHMATAFNIPSVTIYSFLKNGSDWDGSSPTRYGVRGVEHIDLIPEKGLGDCYGSCCIPSHCVNQITVFEVKEAIEKLMSSTKCTR